MTILPFTYLAVFSATLAGAAYIVTKRPAVLKASTYLAAAAVVVELAWLMQAGMKFHYCVLLDPWGVAGVLTMALIIGGVAANLRYDSPRIMVGTLALASLLLSLGYFIFPAPGRASMPMHWLLAFHIFIVSLGISVLGVGFVIGVLILLRSRLLKSDWWGTGDGARWPSLTTLDRMFVKTLGWGIAIMTAGIILGIAYSSEASLKAPWYDDLKVILTFASIILYSVVLVLRRRQGFCTMPVVGLSTLGFAFIFIGLLISGLFNIGFHKF
ncbi:MAG TPA: cytochrome c biogenesis protein CcsA [bacterium]|nr:cytochrome c biogenesis protein CcsA [bacterium]